ncbi:ABC transporter substrate-binding protein [Thermodesulfobacteriota bacterium]
MRKILSFNLTRVTTSLIVFLTALMVLDTGRAVSSEQSVIEGAKKEGKLVVYTSMNVVNMNTMLEAFKKKYPFMKTEVYRSKSQLILNKLVQETRVRKYIADAFSLTFPIWNELIGKGLVGKYDSPERKAYPKGMKDQDNNWTVLYLQVQGMAYNTDHVPADVAPQNYEDLMHPRWKGKKIAMDYREQTWFAVMLEILGEEKGLDFMRRLAEQDLYLRENKTLLTQLLAAREFPILVNTYIDTAAKIKGDGAHIEWRPGSNPIPASTHLVGLYSHSQRPNAAKLFVDYMLSAEGQNILAKTSGKFPARPGAKSDLTPLIKGYELHPVNPFVMSKYKEITKWFAEIFWKR